MLIMKKMYNKIGSIHKLKLVHQFAEWFVSKAAIKNESNVF